MMDQRYRRIPSEYSGSPGETKDPNRSPNSETDPGMDLIHQEAIHVCSEARTPPTTGCCLQLAAESTPEIVKSKRRQQQMHDLYMTRWKNSESYNYDKQNEITDKLCQMEPTFLASGTLSSVHMLLTLLRILFSQFICKYTISQDYYRHRT